MFRTWSTLVFAVVRGRQLYKSPFKPTTNNRQIITRLFALSSMSKAEDKMGNEKSKNKDKSESERNESSIKGGRIFRKNLRAEEKANRGKSLVSSEKHRHL